LTGSKVMATDLRAGAALILAAIAADGDTEISGIHHIERGYVDIVSKMYELGADIRRFEETEQQESLSDISIFAGVRPSWA
jgi:UDP-N-acetylglucosamine 1-carboxyvinyltransferase